MAVSGIDEKWLSPESVKPECIRKIYLHIAEIVFPIPFADFSEYTAGIANRNRIGWNIPRHNAACANDRIVADEDLTVIHQHQIEIGVEILADMDMLAVGHVHGRLEEKALTVASQNALHHGLAALILPGMGVVVFKHHFLAVVPLLLELLFLLNVDGIGVAMFIEDHAAVDSVN